jgi:universal stress protein A
MFLTCFSIHRTGSKPACLPLAKPRAWRQETKRKFDQHLDQLAKMPANLIRVLRYSQDPWKEITAVAAEMAADLLVISTHGRSGLEHFLRGSDAEKIVREAPCPVLVIRSH